ncbi:hypothetical protein TRIATDRAFT_289359 [Trichoderma atroviride IMI 206040]|uniref:Major facilitator superfamily transporter n=1 Tax=Hypocrea atroviridis (strain ATCC 20476 / IMI 206040) TaxID=452589 RepID=G9NH84_HYPAI|nr:uncharacterized protein TRIATDRAFT_289359 [Trichoderma atroviride IMI 206040]EHK49979.1 hypothetical protein TRIATDRAFT_289359 [Trichoderma atroviride IMI 206040]
MGLSNPLRRSRGTRLPMYQNHNSLAKERYSNDGLPPRIVRYVVFTIVGLILLMVGMLARASQVENWKVANGKVGSRPQPPALWEKFPLLQRYYGGIRTLVPLEKNKSEYPKSGDYTPSNPASDGKVENREQEFPSSYSWDNYTGRLEESDIKECFLDAAGKIRPPPIRYYNGRPSGFPQHITGSYEVLNLPEDVCFERYGKFGPYGFGYSIRTGGLGTGEHGENQGAESVWGSGSRVDYRKLDWADIQRRCFQANAGRYKALPAKTPSPNGFFVGSPETAKVQSRDSQPKESDKAKAKGDASAEKTSTGVVKQSRTAIVVRCWDEFLFREDDFANLRSMISELSLASGGRYDVHLLVQVKNDARYPVWADHEIYEQRIRDAIPKEFQGLVTLWTETQMLSLYQGIYDLYSRGPELPVHGVYRGLTMAMQHFAYMHPEYDYFWQWEMDIRYTGHYYDLLSKIENWAKAQPRKGLWERNSRYYFPSVHGTWEDFSHMARVQSEMGAVGSDNVWKNMPGVDGQPPEAATQKKIKTVWGPIRPADEKDWFEGEKDPRPPTTYDADHNQWGVDEEADLITLNPIFDPEGTTWGLKDDITGYNRSLPLPPRRASIITTSRMSRRLLVTMHKMTAHKKQFAFPEMWPSTVALQHGYKAVYAPHPMYVDREWPVDYMAQTYNGGRDGATGGSRTSLYGEREHNLKGLTWFYNSGFGPNLYRRWLGLKVNNDGGEEYEKTADQSGTGSEAGRGEGRMCLPPMLLHPVKGVEIPVEAPPPEELPLEVEMPESDPTA